MLISSLYHLSTTFNMKDLSLAYHPKFLKEGAPPKLLMTLSDETPQQEVPSLPHSMTSKP